jgi:hypothetical protein
MDIYGEQRDLHACMLFSVAPDETVFKRYREISWVNNPKENIKVLSRSNIKEPIKQGQGRTQRFSAPKQPGRCSQKTNNFGNRRTTNSMKTVNR